MRQLEVLAPSAGWGLEREHHISDAPGFNAAIPIGRAGEGQAADTPPAGRIGRLADAVLAHLVAEESLVRVQLTVGALKVLLPIGALANGEFGDALGG